ncbi:MAG: RluA family pseudouridine synthase [Desulfofustis sp.]|nr:RluA family pseudouridine synthase [Desulfofustis sp.]
MNNSWFSSAEGPFSYTVEESFHDLRLDQFLALSLDQFSRSQVTESIKSGEILVNGVTVKPGYRLKPGDVIDGIIEIYSEPMIPRPQDIAFEVLEENPDYLIVNKPPGLVVHPGSGNVDRTLVNGLLFRFGSFKEVGDVFRPGIVHRLDKDTSGVMVVARSSTAHANLVHQFKNRQVQKTYLALVIGEITEEHGRIVAPIGRHPVHRQKMAVREHNGRYAASNWRCSTRFAHHTLLELHIETGRTHQIRVHLAHLGFPVAGDKLYGPSKDHAMFPRQMLHAWKLGFTHPGTGIRIDAQADLPDDFNKVLAQLEAI